METYTQSADIIEQFRKRRRRQWLLAGLLIVVALVFLWADASARKQAHQVTDPVLVGLMIAVAIGVIILSYLNWRCPACDRYLGKTHFPHYCPKCGAKFVEE
jgi:hypothetical protein